MKKIDTDRPDFFSITTVGERGQVVVPKDAREALGLSAGDKLVVLPSRRGNGILLMKEENIKENIIKPLCIDEANKEHIVLIVFSRKKSFHERVYRYRLLPIAVSFPKKMDGSSTSAGSNELSYWGLPTLLRSSNLKVI